MAQGFIALLAAVDALSRVDGLHLLGKQVGIHILFSPKQPKVFTPKPHENCYYYFIFIIVGFFLKFSILIFTWHLFICLFVFF